MKEPKLIKRNGVYYIEYWAGEKRIRKSLKTKNKILARQKFNELAKIDYGNIIAKYVTEVIEEYFKFSNYSDWTKKIKKYQFNEFVNILGLEERYIFEIEKKDILYYIYALKEKGLIETSINKYISNLKQLFGYAQRAGYLISNPLDGISYLKETKKEKIIFKDEDIDRIFKYIKGKKYEPMMYILYYTGLRIGEAGKLKVCDIDFENDIIHVVNNTYSKIKTRRDDYVILFPQLKEYLKEYIKKKGLKEHDFIVDKEPVTSKRFYQYFLKLRRRLDLPREYTPYTFRHTFATKLLLNGTDIYTVSRLLRHSSIDITQKVYIHHDYNSIKRNINYNALNM